MRQVPHALLTRPPLASAGLHPEGIRPTRLVRLACVKHAASVHPEPGSNSHVNIEISLWPDLIWHFLLFVWVVLFSRTCLKRFDFIINKVFFRSRIFRLLVISLFSCQGTAASLDISISQPASHCLPFGGNSDILSLEDEQVNNKMLWFEIFFQQAQCPQKRVKNTLPENFRLPGSAFSILSRSI